MNGYINLNRMDTISIATKEDKVYIVLSNGRHRLGVSCESMDDAKVKMKDMKACIEFGSGWYYINQELEEVRSYKSGREAPCEHYRKIFE